MYIFLFLSQKHILRKSNIMNTEKCCFMCFSPLIGSLNSFLVISLGNAIIIHFNCTVLNIYEKNTYTNMQLNRVHPKEPLKAI